MGLEGQSQAGPGADRGLPAGRLIGAFYSSQVIAPSKRRAQPNQSGSPGAGLPLDRRLRLDSGPFGALLIWIGPAGVGRILTPNPHQRFP